MNTTYKVNVWAIKPRKNSAGKVTSYGVRWAVEGTPFYESFKKRAQAEGFRGELLAAQGRGEAFDRTTGLPISMARSAEDMSWIAFTFRYMDMKWPDLAATARQTVAEALMRVAPVFLAKGKAEPDAKDVRSALRQWGYNTPLRGTDVVPADAAKILDRCARTSRSVKAVTDPEVLRELQRSITRRLDGQPYAPTVARKTRSVLSNALDYAADLRLIDKNPLSDVNWTTMPKGKRKVDKRAVPNPIQARSILAVVRETPRSGRRLRAYFGSMYFCALRPEESTALNKRHLDLPEPTKNEETGELEYGWGQLHLDLAEPYIDARWTDGGTARDARHLKSRNAGEGRTVPCPPEQTQLFYEHIEEFGYGDDGRVFCGEQGDSISKVTYGKLWRAARAVALTPEAHATPLAARPYDLRHAAVSTWLAAGVDPATVAEWAGHSLAVLMEIYAACLYGAEVTARQQVQAALGHRG